jgi:chemotaxis protein CheD
MTEKKERPPQDVVVPFFGKGSGGGDLESVFLHPGDVFASARPCVITTVLGSCVAVCLYDPYCRVGGMNHFVLSRTLPHQESSCRSAEEAISVLIKKVCSLTKGPARNLQAKLFGGSNLFSGGSSVLPSQRSRFQVGKDNVNAARLILSHYNIPIVRELVDQTCGLMLKMVTDTGEVWVRPVNRLSEKSTLEIIRGV